MVLLFWLVNRDYLLHIAVECCMWVQKNYQILKLPRNQPRNPQLRYVQLSRFLTGGGGFW